MAMMKEKVMKMLILMLVLLGLCRKPLTKIIIGLIYWNNWSEILVELTQGSKDDCKVYYFFKYLYYLL